MARGRELRQGRGRVEHRASSGSRLAFERSRLLSAEVASAEGSVGGAERGNRELEVCSEMPSRQS